MAADKKARCCDSCKEGFHCVDCGKRVTPGALRCSTHSPKHTFGGKTYQEVYGSGLQSPGFKKGQCNIAKQEHIRQKISSSLVHMYRQNPDLRREKKAHMQAMNRSGRMFQGRFQNTYGEVYESRLEVRLSELLHARSLAFKKHVPVPLVDGRTKIVDFLVGDVFIEVSGFAFKAWQDDFIDKMAVLRRTIPNPIIVLTYPEHLNGIYAVCSYNIYTGSIYDDQDILEKVAFCSMLYRFSSCRRS